MLLSLHTIAFFPKHLIINHIIPANTSMLQKNLTFNPALLATFRPKLEGETPFTNL